MNIRLYEMKVSGMGPFREQQTVKFDGKTSFIYAPNGHGKTSFIDLVRWCLSGEESHGDFKSIDPKSLMNKDRFNSPQPMGSVELVLTVVDPTGNESMKRIKRTLKYERMAPEEEFVVSTWDNEKATFVNDENPLIRLRELFPPERLNLNLMTGEHMKDFSTSIDNRQLKRQIESLLQFPELKTTRDLLDTARGLLHDEARKVRNRSARQDKAQRDLDAAKSQIISCDKRIEKLSSEIDEVKEAIEAQIDRIKSLSGGQDLEKARDKAQHHLDSLTSQLREKDEELGKTYIGLWRHVVTHAVSDDAKKILQEHADYEERMNNYQQSLGQMKQLRELLEKENCVCLRPLDGDAKSGINREIERLKALAPVKPASKGFNQWTLESWSDKKNYANALAKLQTKVDEHSKLQQDVQKAKQRLREISEDLSDDVGVLYKEAVRVKDELWEKREKLIARKSEIDAEREEARYKAQKLEKRMGGTGSSGEAVQSVAGVAEKYYQAFAEVVEKVVPHYREKLLEEVQSTFRTLYSKNRNASVRLNDNYIPYVLEPSEDGSAKTNVRLSEGEALRLGLALLISIRRVAHERPFLVIDAPFSDLDDTGVEDLLKVIADDDSQVVILCKERFAYNHATIIESIEPTVFQMDWHLNTQRGAKSQGHTTITPSSVDVLKARTKEHGEEVLTDG